MHKNSLLVGCMTFLFLIFTLTLNSYGKDEGVTVRIAYLQSDIHQLACWVAMEKGFFQEEGVKVKIGGIFKAGPEEMSAFASGALDMGYVGEAPATTAVANGTAKVVVLAQVNTEGSAIVVRQNSSIFKVIDLRGKRVAIPGHSTVQDFLLKKALKSSGLKGKDLKIMPLKPPEMIGALRASQIDAFIAWEPFPAKAITMKVGRILIKSAKIWKDHPCCVLVVDKEFLKKYPKTVKSVVRAHVKATDFINLHKSEAIKIGMKYTGMDEMTVKTAMKNVNYTYHLSIDGEREYVKFLTGLKYIKVKNVDEFIKNFINEDILKEVLLK